MAVIHWRKPELHFACIMGCRYFLVSTKKAVLPSCRCWGIWDTSRNMIAPFMHLNGPVVYINRTQNVHSLAWSKTEEYDLVRVLRTMDEGWGSTGIATRRPCSRSASAGRGRGCTSGTSAPPCVP